MYKSSLFIAFLSLVMLYMISDTYAQRGNETLSFSLELSEGNYNAMANRFGERGISSGELSRWLAENVIVEPVEFCCTGEHVPRQVSERSTLAVLIVGENGIIEQNEFHFESPDRPTHFGRLVNTAVIQRTLESAFPDETFFPSDTFFPDETFFPSDTFVRSGSEAERTAVSVSQRARGSSGAQMRGSGGGKASISFLFIPAIKEFELPVNPGAFGFVVDAE